MISYSSSRIAPDDLLTLLTVARLGKYTAAAHVLGVNHTTVSRRIAALEKSVGEPVLANSPDGWEVTLAGEQLLTAAEAVEAALESASRVRGGSGVAGVVRLVAPEGFVDYGGFDKIMGLQRAYRDVQIDLITATQRASKYRSGVDVEIVVGKPEAPHCALQKLGSYALELYVSEDYAAAHGVPTSIAELSDHRFVFYPEHSLGVDGLEGVPAQFPKPAGFFRSNSVRLHVAATRAGIGVGLLPNYAAEGLVRVVPEFSAPMEYWAVVRNESVRRPVVVQVVRALVHIYGAQVERTR